jgi:hypothetical protein
MHCVLEDGVIACSITAPLPGFTYRISWDLNTESAFNANVFSPEALEAYTQIKGLEYSREIANRIRKELEHLRDEFSINLKNARKRRWAPCEPHHIWLSRL